jgi:hypothetical protein
MTSVSLGQRFGINNVIIPKGGPAIVPCRLDFTNTARILIDGEQVVANGKIEFLQGVFIDNADNVDALTFTIQTTDQRLICPPRSQGYFAILTANPPRIIAETPQGGSKIINVDFYNVPIQSQVWRVT